MRMLDFVRIMSFLMAMLSGIVYAKQPFSNWYDELIFKDASFNFELIRTLGYTYEKGADVGETIQTARQIKDGDFQSWYVNWLRTAKRIEQLAQHFQNQNHVVSSRDAYFRDSNYYRTAGFFMVKPDDREKSKSAYKKSRQAFQKAISSLPYIHSIRIPYESTTLPGYLIRVKSKKAPIVIVNTGFDGTAEELYFEMGKALHSRGYNVLLIEGPGQGSVLREQGLPFRPDWETVIKPVVDYVETIEDIDKTRIGLIGISMGGYLAPRAAAFEPRIKALVANGGVYDFGQSVYNSLPKNILPLIDSDPKTFNQSIDANMKQNAMARWFFENGMWTFKVDTPAEFMKKLKSYHLNGIAKKIKMPTLIIDSASDMFMQGQAQALFKAIQGPKTFLLFTQEEAAQSHCQMGAIAISNEKILNWLDKNL